MKQYQKDESKLSPVLKTTIPSPRLEDGLPGREPEYKIWIRTSQWFKIKKIRGERYIDERSKPTWGLIRIAWPNMVVFASSGLKFALKFVVLQIL